MTAFFTIEEARAALKQIRPWMDEIQSIRADILERQPEAWHLIESVAGNGGSAAASQLVLDFDRLDRLVHQVLETGAIFKDINLGLLDFPAWRGDQEVYLCWKYGEPNLEYWHEVEAGFAGRRPIDTF
jgi:hypothetical protein